MRKLRYSEKAVWGLSQRRPRVQPPEKGILVSALLLAPMSAVVAALRLAV